MEVLHLLPATLAEIDEWANFRYWPVSYNSFRSRAFEDCVMESITELPPRPAYRRRS